MRVRVPLRPLNIKQINYAKQQRLLYTYGRYTKRNSIIFSHHIREKKKNAAALSSVGTGLNKIPVLGPFLGALASLPDLGYDLLEFKENPNLKNAGHILLDGINRYTRFTRTPYDDFIGNIGVVDDASQSLGYDILEELGRKITSKKDQSKSKR